MQEQDLSACEVWEEGKGWRRALPGLTQARGCAAGCALPGGRMLVTGGYHILPQSGRLVGDLMVAGGVTLDAAPPTSDIFRSTEILCFGEYSESYFGYKGEGTGSYECRSAVGPRMREPRCEHACIFVAGAVIVLGGYRNELSLGLQLLDSVEALDVDELEDEGTVWSKAWMALPCALPSARSNSGACLVPRARPGVDLRNALLGSLAAAGAAERVAVREIAARPNQPSLGKGLFATEALEEGALVLAEDALVFVPESAIRALPRPTASSETGDVDGGDSVADGGDWAEVAAAWGDEAAAEVWHDCAHDVHNLLAVALVAKLQNGGRTAADLRATFRVPSVFGAASSLDSYGARAEAPADAALDMALAEHKCFGSFFGEASGSGGGERSNAREVVALARMMRSHSIETEVELEAAEGEAAAAVVVRGHSLCLLQSATNHSCDDAEINCAMVSAYGAEEDSPAATMIATRAIARGEELLIDYLAGLQLSPAERKEALRERYDISCDCERCTEA